MKILYLCMDRGIDVGGLKGGSIHVHAFIRALTDLGHEVTAVFTKVAAPESMASELSADICSSPLAAWNRDLERFLRAANRFMRRDPRRNTDSMRALHNLAFYEAAAAAAQRFDPDLIYERYSLWGMAGLRLAKQRSIPMVLEVNAPLAYEEMRYRAGLTCAPLARWVEQTIWRKADLLVAVSDSLRCQIRNAKVAPELIHVLPNAVDPRLFRRDSDGSSVREQFKLAGQFVIGFVGTFKPWHGTDLLLDAFQDLHRANASTHLLLVGDGPLRVQFEERVRKAGLEQAVTIAGAVPHQDVPRYLAAMDVAVAPYPAVDDFYYSPLKLFEYMAAGRAVVASRAGQVAEVISDGVTGLLFDPGDCAGLVACIRRLENNKSLRNELGIRANAACSGRTWTQNATRIIDWVEPLVNKRNLMARPNAAGDQLQHSA